ncbi:MAG: hypothetical protein WHT29_12480 [Bacteroidales bacterium]
MKYIVIFFIGLLLVSCDPHSAFTECSYKYPINAIGLNDTIKTTDTIWIENDLDAKLCLNEGIYKNGKGYETPYFFKLVNDSFVRYEPKIIGSTDFNFTGDRYKSKYGIVFKELGIYSLSMFGGMLRNGKDSSIGLKGYFNVSSNNMNLLPASVKMPAWEIGQPNKYYVYFLRVIE